MISIDKLQEYLIKLDVEDTLLRFNYTDEIFHYTALKNMESILFNQKEKIVLWASQYDCLNDASEGTVAEERYNQVCEELKDTGKISKELYQELIQIKPSINETFFTWENGKPRVYEGQYTTFIASFCREKDLLPMWNYYSKGDMFEGVNLGMIPQKVKTCLEGMIDKKMVVSLNYVVYDTKEQEAIIKKFLLKIIKKYKDKFHANVKTVVSTQLAFWNMVFKYEYFKHEQEVRIIIRIANEYKDSFKIRNRVNAGYIIPYIELEIEKKALTSITLGPFRGTENQKNSQMKIINTILKDHGYQVDVTDSKIPVRY